jgi:predicted RNA-binding protein with PIN domain
MRYLVDGHNLIPNLPGLSLEQIDDEVELVQRLQTFCAQGAHQVEVYFDNAPAGHTGVRRFGRVTAHFVRAGKTADAAIAHRLTALGRSARQWCVVSSDRSVLAAARAAQAAVLLSQEFALRMQPLPVTPGDEKRETPPDPGEVDEWLQIFQQGKIPKRRSSRDEKNRQS